MSLKHARISKKLGSYEQPIWNFSMFTADCSIWQNGRSVMDMAKDKENQEIIVLLS